MGPHVIRIQVRHDSEKKWLTTMYKLMDEELEEIIDDWPVEWKVSVSIEELSNIEVSPPTDALVDQAQAQESEQSPGL